jgi:hypothetical protein
LISSIPKLGGCWTDAIVFCFSTPLAVCSANRRCATCLVIPYRFGLCAMAEIFLAFRFGRLEMLIRALSLFRQFTSNLKRPDRSV